MILAFGTVARAFALSVTIGAIGFTSVPEPATASGWINQGIESQKAKQAPPPPPKATPPKPKADAPAKAPTAAQAMQASAKDAGSGIDKCAQAPQQPKLFECIAQRLEKLANDLEKNPAIKPVAPQTVAVVREAAKEVKAATNKEQVVSALQKASAVIAAAVSATKDGQVDKFGPKVGVEAVSGALNKAIAAVQKSI